MTELAFRSATALAAAIRAREIGCRELLEHYLERVERHNPALNAIIVTDLRGARPRADEADAALAHGESWGPLHGLPTTVKESFDVMGMPTTWGLIELKGNIAAANALAVDRLLAAGAVIFGKTNVPVLLADSQSYNLIYGTTNNPWDLSLTPGGSSGGAAAALAAGLTGLELGSDIGGSIRNPAHYCGVYGHKPTYGIAPPRGQALYGNVAASDISVIGPLARSAEDLALALDIIAGPDPIEAAGWRLNLAPPRGNNFSDYRIAVMLDDPNCEVDREVQDILQRLVDFLAGRGVRISDRARPNIDTTELHAVYIRLLRAATSRRLAQDAFERHVEDARGLDPTDQSYFARMMRGVTLTHRDWLAGNEERHRLRLKWAEFFRDYDLLLCPVTAGAAYPHDHDHEGERWKRMIQINGKPAPTINDLFWAGLCGLVYLPATVAPAGLTAKGLPVGVQIVGPQYGDKSCIAFAALLEHAYRGFVAPPCFA
ncbi:MAG: amidase [Alphaproteobacteria bacterium]|nr:amidase [Alphaproteobacteria bacterium]